MSRFLKKIKFIIISMSLIFIIVGILAYTDLFSQKKLNSLPSSTEVKGNVTDGNTSSKSTTNILLLDNKSDSMVVASVDNSSKDIQLTPVTSTGYFDRSDMEDLVTNVEENINMNLDKFLQVDTSELMNVISVLDNISVNIKSEDIEIINNLIPKFYAEFDNKAKGEMKLITSPGLQNINEYQAMAYVSAVGKDSNKQKEALISFIKSIKDLSFNKYFEIYSRVKPYIETNLTIPDMLELASTDYEFK